MSGSRVFLDVFGSTKRTQLRRAGPNSYHEARASSSSLEFSSDWARNVSGGISGSGAGRPVSRLISWRIATAVSWDSFLNSRLASTAEKTSSTLLPCSNAKCVFFSSLSTLRLRCPTAPPLCTFEPAGSVRVVTRTGRRTCLVSCNADNDVKVFGLAVRRWAAWFLSCNADKWLRSDVAHGGLR